MENQVAKLDSKEAPIADKPDLSKKTKSIAILTLILIIIMACSGYYFRADKKAYKLWKVAQAELLIYDAWRTFDEVGCEQIAVDKFTQIGLNNARFVSQAYDIIESCNKPTDSFTYKLLKNGNNSKRVVYEKTMIDWENSGNLIYRKRDVQRSFERLGAVTEAAAVSREIRELHRIEQLEQESDVKLWDDVLKPTSLLDFIPIPQLKGKTVVKGFKKYGKANKAWKAAKIAKGSFRAFSKGRAIRQIKKRKKAEARARYDLCRKTNKKRICRKEFISTMKTV